MNEEEAIERLKYIDMQYDCNNYYSRYDLDCIETVLNLLEKKDKIIDLMGEKIFEEGIVWENKEDVKQYFENKVTDTNVGERKVENGN